VTDHEHENGFEHLDVSLFDLDREYDLGIKHEANTDGPLGYVAEPYLLLYISYAATTGLTRPSGTLHYALRRSLWEDGLEAGPGDQRQLREQAVDRIAADLLAIDRGDELPWLTEGGRLYLPADPPPDAGDDARH
jgi:hypothetical protein